MRVYCGDHLPLDSDDEDSDEGPMVPNRVMDEDEILLENMKRCALAWTQQAPSLF